MGESEKKTRIGQQRQKTNEEAITPEFPNLLDVAHGNALEMIHIQGREFLIAQREPGRRGSMAGLDKKLKKKEDEKEKRVERRRSTTVTKNTKKFFDKTYQLTS